MATLCGDQSLEDAIQVLRDRQAVYEKQEPPDIPDTKYWLDLVNKLDAEIEIPPPRKRPVPLSPVRSYSGSREGFKKHSDAEGNEDAVPKSSPSSPPRTAGKKLTIQNMRSNPARSMTSRTSKAADPGVPVTKTISGLGQVIRGVNKDTVYESASTKQRKSNQEDGLPAQKNSGGVSGPSSDDEPGGGMLSWQREFFKDERKTSKDGADNDDPMEANPGYTATDHKLRIRQVSKELDMPYGPLMLAVNVFDKYASHPEGGYDPDARLLMHDFMKVLDELCTAGSIEDLPQEYIHSAFITADRDEGGDIDLMEFCIWYSSHSFDEEMSLTTDELERRQLARKLKVDIMDLERYQKAFGEYDTDGSGNIDMEEFQNILNACLKLPPGQSLSQDRTDAFWRECDTDGSGEVDFEEFVVFYQKYFETTDGTDPLTNFYHSFRK
jgi:Ca2+-binding EF-hand superfamily protein